VFAIQTEIATTVTGALQATLLESTSAVADVGGTQNPSALDAYLQGVKLANSTFNEENVRGEIAAYTKAINLDGHYARAYAVRSIAFSNLGRLLTDEAAISKAFDQARSDAETALKLAPELGTAHRALGAILYTAFHDFAGAEAEYGRALALAPGDAGVLRSAAAFFSSLGRPAEAVPLAQQAVRLDPLNARSVRTLGLVLYDARRYGEAISTLNRALSLDPGLQQVISSSLGLAHMWAGDNEAARTACEKTPQVWQNQVCLALVYRRLDREPQAQAVLRALMDGMGDTAAFQYAQIYAQWGDTSRALEWLETAYRLRDPGLFELKSDALIDPLRREPRFQEIEQRVFSLR
jgi:tetratricopeptide (TPR) repeat protein